MFDTISLNKNGIGCCCAPIELGVCVKMRGGRPSETSGVQGRERKRDDEGGAPYSEQTTRNENSHVRGGEWI